MPIPWDHYEETKQVEALEKVLAEWMVAAGHRRVAETLRAEAESADLLADESDDRAEDIALDLIEDRPEWRDDLLLNRADPRLPKIVSPLKEDAS